MERARDGCRMDRPDKPGDDKVGPGGTYPHGPARVLLTIIDREPNAVRRALATD